MFGNILFAASMTQSLMLAILGLLALIIIAFATQIPAPKPKRRVSITKNRQLALPAPEDDDEEVKPYELPPPPAPRPGVPNQQQLKAIIAKEPDQALLVLKNWINEDPPVSKKKRV